MDKKRILVTGGSGFIGSHLVDRLVKDGHAVWCIDNNSTSTIEYQNPGCIYVDHDLINDDTLRSWTIDVIYHLAARPRIQPSLKNPKFTLTNNILSTINVLEYAKITGCKVIFASSSSVSGDEYANPYTMSKHIGEELCKMYKEIYGVKVHIARFYNVYGPRMIGDTEFGTVLGIWLERYKKGKSLKITGSGKQRRDYTHVLDIVDGLISIEKNWTTQFVPYELGRGENYNLLELSNLFPNATIEHIDRPKGEADNTLCSYMSRTIDWKPERNVTDFILESTKEDQWRK